MPTRLGVDYWRARAEQTRALARQITDAHAKAQIPRIAAGYDRLAERAEAANATDELIRRNHELLAQADAARASCRATVQQSIVGRECRRATMLRSLALMAYAVILSEDALATQRTWHQMRVAGLLRSLGLAAFPWRPDRWPGRTRT